LDRYLAWLNHELFTLGGASVSAGGLLRTLAMLVALVWLSSWLRRWMVARALVRFQHMDLGTREAVASVVHYLALVLGIALILQNAGIRLTALGVVAGAVGVGVGFGLQNVISNFISGLIIMLERPVKVGDPVEMGSVSGVVREIGARRTTIVTPDQVAVLVPNQRLITDNVTNMGYLGRPVRLRLPVAVPADVGLATLRERLLAAARAEPRVLADPPPALLITSVGAATPTAELAVWHAPTEASRQDLAAALNAQIARLLHEPAPQPAAPRATGHPANAPA
jgi:small-conductance mechanosensitive channel